MSRTMLTLVLAAALALAGGYAAVMFATIPQEEVATTTPSGGGGILPHDSGVRGIILLGPTCPVERIPPDPACADKPYETGVSISRAGSSATFAITQSRADGTFSIALSPGAYVVTAGSGAMLPRCTPVDFTVAAGSYATANISCDTGIR